MVQSSWFYSKLSFLSRVEYASTVMDSSLITVIAPFLVGYALLSMTTFCSHRQIRRHVRNLEERIITLEQTQSHQPQTSQVLYYSPQQQPQIYPNYTQAHPVPLQQHSYV